MKKSRDLENKERVWISRCYIKSEKDKLKGSSCCQLNRLTLLQRLIWVPLPFSKVWNKNQKHLWMAPVIHLKITLWLKRDEITCLLTLLRSIRVVMMAYRRRKKLMIFRKYLTMTIEKASDPPSSRVWCIQINRGLHLG